MYSYSRSASRLMPQCPPSSPVPRESPPRRAASAISINSLSFAYTRPVLGGGLQPSLFFSTRTFSKYSRALRSEEDIFGKLFCFTGTQCNKLLLIGTRRLRKFYATPGLAIFSIFLARDLHHRAPWNVRGCGNFVLFQSRLNAQPVYNFRPPRFFTGKRCYIF